MPQPSEAQPQSRLIHFIHLTRLHKPVGTILLLWPALWALWLSAGGFPRLDILLIFIAGGFVMRAAGCVINDYADRDFDAHVKRTNYRPIATGKVRPGEALALFAALSLAGFGLVLLTNALTVKYAAAGILIIALYPFMKRVTHLPQLVLGVAWGWSIPMAFAAHSGAVPAPAWVLVVGVICWTVVFDTFYAMVDRDDDVKIGIKSTAVLFGDWDLHIIAMLQVAALLCFVVAGPLFDLRGTYYLAVAAVALLFARQLFVARRRDRDGAFRAFMDNRYIGATLFAGIVLDYLVSG